MQPRKELEMFTNSRPLHYPKSATSPGKGLSCGCDLRKIVQHLTLLSRMLAPRLPVAMLVTAM